MNTKQSPFSWQDKRVLRRIREKCPDYGSALGVYLALTVAASDSQSERFQATHQWLGQLAGFSIRTVRSRLHELAAIGVISISTPVMKTASTFCLLPFGSGCRTSGNGCRAFGNETAPPLPPLEAKEVKKVPGKPLTTPKRISIEKQLTQLRAEEKQLKGDLSDLVMRETFPEKVQRQQALAGQIADLEAALR